MKFIADIHIHSKFSRATAKNLDLEHLYVFAQLKGITVVGSGDCTHPGWFCEIKDKLEPVEEGLFRLKKDIASVCDQQVPLSCRNPVRFILSTEISNIYKKDGRTRKNHNLVFLPDLDSAEAFNARLDALGNIKSDGRPILGLDARDLLEIVLEAADDAFLIPAHIWTPWFSLLGSKSGFDSVEACFEDLTPHIFAVETGLSSDPPMNWQVSDLDGLTLVSNSDAHSPSKLGREANIFNTQLSYGAMKQALETGDPDQFGGTIEFYPEEGKYHFDGHRKCGVCCRPDKTDGLKCRCPVCGKPLTLGVLYRVAELADRQPGQKPDRTHPFFNRVPLTDILGEILKVGPATKKVAVHYNQALECLGPEIQILHQLPLDPIEKAGIPLLGEAIDRMRQGNIDISPGYDGEFGRIKIFKSGEREKLKGQKPLFALSADHPCQEAAFKEKISPLPGKPVLKVPDIRRSSANPLPTLNPEQKKAVDHARGPLLIVAGPGTGKTLTITHRIARLIDLGACGPDRILAVTFTNKAAEEMRHRLEALLGGSDRLPLVNTFHALCALILKEQNQNKNQRIIDDSDREPILADAIDFVSANGIEVTLKPGDLWRAIIDAKQNILGPEALDQGLAAFDRLQIAAVYAAYQKMLAVQKRFDYEDLVFAAVRLLEGDNELCGLYRKRFTHIFIDEYQDVNTGQYRLVQALAPPGKSETCICAIGDPDQSIYGFRGSDARFFNRFARDYPDAKMIHLGRNYRSSKTILEASGQVIQHQRKISSGIDGIRKITIIKAATEKTEAQTIAGIIEQMVGGTGFHSIDTGWVDSPDGSPQRSYSDFSVLYRTGDQHRAFARVFTRRGIPFQTVNKDKALAGKGMRELISLVKIIHDQGSYTDLTRALSVMGVGVGKKTLQQLKNWGYKQGYDLKELLFNAKRFPIDGMGRTQQMRLNGFISDLDDLKKQTADLALDQKLRYLARNRKISSLLEDRKDGQNPLTALLDRVSGSNRSPSDFLMDLALGADTDWYSYQVEKTALMSMHAAKGLEFPVVFITGCEADLIPFRRSADHVPDIDEERRLFYVAMTRAKEALYLSYAKKRRIYGRYQKQSPSPFVADIKEELLKEKRFARHKKKAVQAQLALFK